MLRIYSLDVRETCNQAPGRLCIIHRYPTRFINVTPPPPYPSPSHPYMGGIETSLISESV